MKPFFQVDVEETCLGIIEGVGSEGGVEPGVDDGQVGTQDCEGSVVGSVYHCSSSLLN